MFAQVGNVDNIRLHLQGMEAAAFDAAGAAA